MKNKWNKQYYKMNKKWKKELKRISKNCSPFEYEDGFGYFVTHMRWMLEYYTLGENVWQSDNTRQEAISTLTEALKEYDEWQNCEDKYYIHHETGGKENGKGVIIDGKPTDWWIEYKYDDYKTNSEEYLKEYNEHRRKFFDIVYENIESWWD